MIFFLRIDRIGEQLCLDQRTATCVDLEIEQIRSHMNPLRLFGGSGWCARCRCSNRSCRTGGLRNFRTRWRRGCRGCGRCACRRRGAQLRRVVLLPRLPVEKKHKSQCGEQEGTCAGHGFLVPRDAASARREGVLGFGFAALSASCNRRTVKNTRTRKPARIVPGWRYSFNATVACDAPSLRQIPSRSARK
jgi:hypothetical protein